MESIAPRTKKAFVLCTLTYNSRTVIGCFALRLPTILISCAGSLGQGKDWLHYRRTVQKDLMRPKEGDQF
jgi:hypothetical protein